MTPPIKPSSTRSTPSKPRTKRAEQTAAFMDELFPVQEGEREIEGLKVVSIDKVKPRLNQPRRNFIASRLTELATDIRGLRERGGGIGGTGILQALLVVPNADGSYTLVAGERRWRAAQEAENTEVPILVRAQNNEEAYEDALRENIQREDLTAIEEADGIRATMDSRKFSVRQAAEYYGKDRGWINNRIKLAKARDDVKSMIDLVAQTDPERKILSHALLIQDVADPKIRSKLIRAVVSDQISFVALTQMVEDSRRVTPELAGLVPPGHTGAQGVGTPLAASTPATNDVGAIPSGRPNAANPAGDWKGASAPHKSSIPTVPNPQTQFIQPARSYLAEALRLYQEETVQPPDQLTADLDGVIELATRIKDAANKSKRRAK